MYFKKVNIVLLYIMQHLDTSGTSKHKELTHGCTVSSAAHKSCTCPGSSVGRVSTPRNFTDSIPGRDIPKSLKNVLAAPRLALRLM